MTELIIPPPWTQAAVCASVDPELWFPEKGNSAARAKKICATCPVREPCLQYALDNDDRFGVFGGTTERDRRKIRGNTKFCKHCGAEYAPGRSHAAFCSDECRSESRRLTKEAYERTRTAA
jgi:hypothetical protein